MARTHVTCNLNGEDVEFLCDQDETLLNALRDDVGLNGVKEGCGTGDCGACSILLDGNLTCSCLVFAPEANGSTIVTVEGLATADELHPLQQAFLEGAALQCGICTPGFLVAAKALLDRNPDPTETEVRYALAGNLCRCTGYDKIIRAVLDAATHLRTGAGAPIAAD
jgi:aerobic carbon-monoxide dehydrogenase small subunit